MIGSAVSARCDCVTFSRNPFTVAFGAIGTAGGRNAYFSAFEGGILNLAPAAGWFGTEGGITRYDGREWVSWTHADGLGAPNTDGRPSSRNTGLGTRERHDLGVLSGGVATYNPSYVFSVLVDDQDALWAGTWGGGLARFDGEHWQNYTEADGLAGNIVYALARDPRSGVLWIGTNKGLSRFDGSHWQNYGHHEGLNNLDVYSIAVADDGDVWVGTREAVLRVGIE